MTFFIGFLSASSLGERGLDGLARPVPGPLQRLLPASVEALALLLDEIAERLLANETIERQEIQEIIHGAEPEPEGGDAERVAAPAAEALVSKRPERE